MEQGQSISPEIYAKMQTGEPVASYKKTTLGKVQVQVLNSWSGKMEFLILKGDPKKNEEGTIVDTWSVQEDTFFQRVNKRLFETGNLKKFVRPTLAVEKSPNDITDEEIEATLKSPYFKLTNKLSQFTSPAPVYRFLEMAKEFEKSDKFIKAIEARISELEV